MRKNGLDLSTCSFGIVARESGLKSIQVDFGVRADKNTIKLYARY